MRSRYLTTLAVVLAVIMGISVCGCNKEEPVREDTAPTESVEPAIKYVPPRKPVVEEPVRLQQK